MYRLARRAWVELLHELGEQVAAGNGGTQPSADRSEL